MADLAGRGGRGLAVVLDIGWQENVRRLQSAKRAERQKLTRPEVLRSLRDRYRLLRPASVESLALEVSDLAATDAAFRILDWIGPA